MCVPLQSGEMKQIISVICHVTKHRYELLLYLTMLNCKKWLTSMVFPNEYISNI